MDQPFKKVPFGPGAFRLFLAIVVMVHHSLPLRGGAWAVDVFFILSGYWITRMWNGRYSRTRANYMTFLVSRWWRLAPVFFVCLTLGLGSAASLHGMEVFGILNRPAWWIGQLTIAGSSHVGRILPPTWSLDVEMQFYIFAPALIYIFARLNSAVRWSLIVGLLIVPSVFFFRDTPADTARVGLFGGLFLAGTALALSDWVADRRTAIGGVSLLVGVTLLLALFTPIRSGIWCDGDFGPLHTPWVSSWWIVGAVLVVPFISRNVRIRSSRLDRLLGNLAYPLYLFHWIPREWYYRLCETNSPGWARTGFLLANFAIAIGGAILILLFVDQPIDRMRNSWVVSRLLTQAQVRGSVPPGPSCEEVSA